MKQQVKANVLKGLFGRLGQPQATAVVVGPAVRREGQPCLSAFFGEAALHRKLEELGAPLFVGVRRQLQLALFGFHLFLETPLHCLLRIDQQRLLFGVGRVADIAGDKTLAPRLLVMLEQGDLHVAGAYRRRQYAQRSGVQVPGRIHVVIHLVKAAQHLLQDQKVRRLGIRRTHEIPAPADIGHADSRVVDCGNVNLSGMPQAIPGLLMLTLP